MPLDVLATLDHADDEVRVLKINVRMPDGGWVAPGALVGHSVLEMLRAFGIPMRSECGGACVCAACHVRIPEAWRSRMPTPSAEEAAKLDEIPDADDASRLACQIVMTPELDGLELKLNPESLIPQTYWIAG